MKVRERAKVTEQMQIAADIYSLRLQVSFAGEVKAGQFISLFCADGRRLLPRPISVCDADGASGEIRVVYRVAGEGTREFSKLAAGDGITVMGPMGNGFPCREAAGKHVLLVGGGIGIPPVYFAAKTLMNLPDAERPASVRIAAGYRSSDTYLLQEMQQTAPVLISTDDGSLGVRGTVLDAITQEEAETDLIFSCGPKVMLRALKEFSEKRGICCYVSMEERMACGIGVCLGCVTKTTRTDPHSMVKNARVCADGPVFDAEEVDLS